MGVLCKYTYAVWVLEYAEISLVLPEDGLDGLGGKVMRLACSFEPLGWTIYPLIPICSPPPGRQGGRRNKLISAWLVVVEGMLSCSFLFFFFPPSLPARTLTAGDYVHSWGESLFYLSRRQSHGYSIWYHDLILPDRV